MKIKINILPTLFLSLTLFSSLSANTFSVKKYFATGSQKAFGLGSLQLSFNTKDDEKHTIKLKTRGPNFGTGVISGLLFVIGNEETHSAVKSEEVEIGLGGYFRSSYFFFLHEAGYKKSSEQGRSWPSDQVEIEVKEKKKLLRKNKFKIKMKVNNDMNTKQLEDEETTQEKNNQISFFHIPYLELMSTTLQSPTLTSLLLFTPLIAASFKNKKGGVFFLPLIGFSTKTIASIIMKSLWNEKDPLPYKDYSVLRNTLFSFLGSASTIHGLGYINGGSIRKCTEAERNMSLFQELKSKIFSRGKIK